MTGEVNWFENDESLVIKPVSGVAVYTNPNGDIVIRQQGSFGEDDSFIFFPVEHAQAVINAIKRESEKE